MANFEPDQSPKSSWGQFSSFRTLGGGSFNVSRANAMGVDDEESRLFEVGVSTPSEGEGNNIHKSPAVNQDLDSPMCVEDGKGDKSGITSVHSSHSSSTSPLEHVCMKCGVETLSLHFSYPCSCYTVCRKCAMKLATGGKCKFCGQFYSTFTTTRMANRAKGSDTDSDSGSGEKA